MADRLEPFTQRTRKVLAFARDEARRLHKAQLGSEHLLIGLLLDEGSVGARVLQDLGLRVEAVRRLVEEATGFGDYKGERIEIADETQQIIQSAISEARGMGHRYIGTEHLLWALMSQGGSTAVNLLSDQGITQAKVKEQTNQTLKEIPTRKDVSESFDWRQYYVAQISGLFKSAIDNIWQSEIAQLIELSARADALNPQLEELAEMLAEPNSFEEIPEDVKQSVDEITSIVHDLRETVGRL